MKNIVAYSNPKSDIVKRYIDLKDSIVSLSDINMKVVMITSPKEDGRNSDLVANLAVVISKSEYNVLIIDCNIENSTLNKIFEVKLEKGLTDYVLNNESLENVIKSTDLNNLKLITSGQQDTDVLGNKKIEILIEASKKKFDYIIINGPAVLKSSATQVLAKYCDGIVLVVEHEKTELEDIKRAQVNLERFKEKILGVALNNYKVY